MGNKDLNYQEMIELLRENDVIPDIRCSKEDLEVLVDELEIVDENKMYT